MVDAGILPTPSISWPATSKGKWQREHDAFQKLRPQLLQTHQGKFVAIHEGRVVESGDDKIDVALRAYGSGGCVPIFVGLVTDQPALIERIPSPRVYRP